MTTSDEELQALARQVGERCMAVGRRLATVESCTGGWIAKAITDIAGSSDWFECGWVSYSNAAKEQLVGVEAETLQSQGAVSREAVAEMALGALARCAADITVAVSGIAGPGGALPGKPAGTVWFAWACNTRDGVKVHTAIEQFDGDREAVRRATVAHALKGLARLVCD